MVCSKSVCSCVYSVTVCVCVSVLVQAVLRENLTALQNEVQQYKRAVDKLTTEHTHCTGTRVCVCVFAFRWNEQIMNTFPY